MNTNSKAVTALILVVIMTGLAMTPTLADDADADSYVVKIGTVEYSTFNGAMAAANGMSGEVTLEIYGKVLYDADTPNLIGGYSKISFVGMTDDAEVSIARTVANSAGYITGNGGNNPEVHFENLILSRPGGSYGSGDAGFMSQYFTVYRTGDVSYTNCSFPNGACTQGTVTSYTDCEFNNTTPGQYSLWVYANTTCTVTNSHFTGVRGIKMYSEDVRGVENPPRDNHLILRGTEFSGIVSEKPAIVLTYAGSVILEGNDYPEKGVFWLDTAYNEFCNGTRVVADITDIPCTNDNGDCGVLVTDSDGNSKIYTRIADITEDVAQAGSRVTLMYDTTGEAPVELPSGVILDLNHHEADNVTADTVIDGYVPEPEPEPEPDHPFVPGWDDDEDYLPTSPSVPGTESSDKDDTRTYVLIAAIAAVVVVMVMMVEAMNRGKL